MQQWSLLRSPRWRGSLAKAAWAAKKKLEAGLVPIALLCLYVFKKSWVILAVVLLLGFSLFPPSTL